MQSFLSVPFCTRSVNESTQTLGDYSGAANNSAFDAAFTSPSSQPCAALDCPTSTSIPSLTPSGRLPAAASASSATSSSSSDLFLPGEVGIARAAFLVVVLIAAEVISRCRHHRKSKQSRQGIIPTAFALTAETSILEALWTARSSFTPLRRRIVYSSRLLRMPLCALLLPLALLTLLSTLCSFSEDVGFVTVGSDDGESVTFLPKLSAGETHPSFSKPSSDLRSIFGPHVLYASSAYVSGSGYLLDALVDMRSASISGSLMVQGLDIGGAIADMQQRMQVLEATITSQANTLSQQAIVLNQQQTDKASLEARLSALEAAMEGMQSLNAGDSTLSPLVSTVLGLRDLTGTSALVTTVQAVQAGQSIEQNLTACTSMTDAQTVATSDLNIRLTAVEKISGTSTLISTIDSLSTSVSNLQSRLAEVETVSGTSALVQSVSTAVELRSRVFAVEQGTLSMNATAYSQAATLSFHSSMLSVITANTSRLTATVASILMTEQAQGNNVITLQSRMAAVEGLIGNSTLVTSVRNLTTKADVVQTSIFNLGARLVAVEAISGTSLLVTNVSKISTMVFNLQSRLVAVETVSGTSALVQTVSAASGLASRVSIVEQNVLSLNFSAVAQATILSSHSSLLFFVTMNTTTLFSTLASILVTQQTQSNNISALSSAVINLQLRSTSLGTSVTSLQSTTTSLGASVTSLQSTSISQGQSLTSLSNTVTTLQASGVSSYGKQVWTTPGTYSFTVPNGISTVYLTGCGGGGGTSINGIAGRAGGGAGATALFQAVSVTPGQVISVTVGSGGSAATTCLYSGVPSGGTTSFGSILSLPGGGGGRCSNGGQGIYNGLAGGAGGTDAFGSMGGISVGAGGLGNGAYGSGSNNGFGGFLMVEWL
jgi:uncharacterized coiled-coil protein SlyX